VVGASRTKSAIGTVELLSELGEFVELAELDGLANLSISLGGDHRRRDGILMEIF
jgi:hypothetical protein